MIQKNNVSCFMLYMYSIWYYIVSRVITPCISCFTTPINSSSVYVYIYIFISCDILHKHATVHEVTVKVNT